MARPQIALISPPPAAGRETTLRFRISALGTATAVKLHAFRPGCKFEQTPGVSGSPFRLDRQTNLLLQTGSNYTMQPPLSSGQMQGLSQGFGSSAPEGPSFPVVGGAAEFSITGVPGVDGGALSSADEKAGPDLAALARASALAGYQRTISADGGCEPRAVILVRDTDAKWHVLKPDGSYDETSLGGVSAQPVRGPIYALRGRRTLTFGNTAALRTKLDPLMRGPAMSTCSGTSSALLNPDYPVGIRESGGDLVFRVRSGPNGTSCTINMRLAGLPAGANAAARFSVSQDGTKCRASSGSTMNELMIRVMIRLLINSAFGESDPLPQMIMPPAVPAPGTFRIAEAGWLDPFAVPGSGTRFGWRTTATPIVGELSCSATLVNDHGVELRLDSVDVDLPDGTSYP
jgi:hypothetical protein